MSALLDFPVIKNPLIGSKDHEKEPDEIPFTSILENNGLLAGHLLTQIGTDIEQFDPLLGESFLMKLAEKVEENPEANYSEIVIFELDGKQATIYDFVEGCLQILYDPQAVDTRQVVQKSNKAVEIIHQLFTKKRDYIIYTLPDSMILSKNYFQPNNISNTDFAIALFSFLLSQEVDITKFANSYKLTPVLTCHFEKYLEADAQFSKRESVACPM